MVMWIKKEIGFDKSKITIKCYVLEKKFLVAKEEIAAQRPMRCRKLVKSQLKNRKVSHGTCGKSQ